MTDDTSPADDAPTGSDDGADDRSSRILPRELILLAVAVLGIVGTVVFFSKWKSLDDDRADREEVVETATRFSQALFTFDHTTLNEDFDRIVEFAVEDFQEEAADVFGDEDTRRGLIENRVGSRAETVDIFVQSVDDGRASVFAVVDQRVANASFPEPVADTVRLNIGLVETGGEWKVGDVNVVTGPGRAIPEVPTADLPEAEAGG